MRGLKHCRTVVKALNSGMPTLSALARQMGDKKVEAYIKLWLIDLNMTLELKTPFKEHQIDTISFYIVDKYRNLNIADINLIFNGVKTGEYKGIYDRITIPTVMGWFKQYFDERCNMAGELSYQQSVQHKSAFANVPRQVERVANDFKKAKEWYSRERSNQMIENAKNKKKAK